MNKSLILGVLILVCSSVSANTIITITDRCENPSWDEAQFFIQTFIYPSWFNCGYREFVVPAVYEQQVKSFSDWRFREMFRKKLGHFYAYADALKGDAKEAAKTLYQRFWFHVGKVTRRGLYTAIGASILGNGIYNDSILQSLLGLFVINSAVQSGYSHYQQAQITKELLNRYGQLITPLSYE